VSRLVCFAGASLTADDVRTIAPGALVLPPIGHGDLIRLHAEPGDRVVILDGEFLERTPVRHKEVLMLIDRGVHVWGAAGLGAMRAAELEREGMHGVGAIFRLYRAGVLADADVAVLHHGPDRGYAAKTDALINVLLTVRRAGRLGVVSPEEATVIIATAAAMLFHQRTYEAVLRSAIAGGLTLAAADRFRTALPAIISTVQRSDARRAVAAAARWPSLEAPVVRAARPNRMLLNWIAREDVVDRGTPEAHTDLDVVNVYRAFAPDFATLHHHINLTALVSTMEAGTGGKDSSETLDGLAWEFARARGILGGRGVVEPGLVRWLHAHERDLPMSRQVALVLARSMALDVGSSRFTDLVRTLKLRGRFERGVEVVRQARLTNEAMVRKHPGHQIERLAAGPLSQWFLDQWHGRDTPVPAMADRGFRDTGDMLGHLRSLFLFGRSNPSLGDLSVTTAAATLT